MDISVNISFYVVEERNILPALNRTIRERLVVCFPADREYFQHRSRWYTVPVYIIIGGTNKDSIVVHIAVVERMVVAGKEQEKVWVAGVQSLFVLPDYWGKGVSDKIMSITMDEAMKREFDVGLLFCLPKLDKVYRRMEWKKIDTRIYMIDEQKRKVSMHLKILQCSIL